MSVLPAVGVESPIQVRNPSALDLFMFSASAWLLHRIHYDTPYTIEHEGHPGLLIHGPLQGVYLVQTAESWLGNNSGWPRSPIGISPLPIWGTRWSAEGP